MNRLSAKAIYPKLYCKRVYNISNETCVHCTVNAHLSGCFWTVMEGSERVLLSIAADIVTKA
jgi:hypothetical protein